MCDSQVAPAHVRRVCLFHLAGVVVGVEGVEGVEGGVMRLLGFLKRSMTISKTRPTIANDPMPRAMYATVWVLFDLCGVLTAGPGVPAGSSTMAYAPTTPGAFQPVSLYW